MRKSGERSKTQDRFRADGERDLRIGYVISTIRNRHLDRLRMAEREQRRLRRATAGRDVRYVTHNGLRRATA